MPKVSPQIEVLAKAICGKGATQEQYELALSVADSELMVLKVRAARAEVIERMRNVRVPRKDKKQGFPTAQEYAEGLLALECGKPRPLIVLFNRAAHAVLAGGANQTKDQKLAQPAEEQQLGVKQQLGADAAQPAPEDISPPQLHDDVTALQYALPDLLRLDRYLQSAISRRRRAIRDFVACSILNAEHRARREGLEATAWGGAGD
jgi:Fic family protein